MSKRQALISISILCLFGGFIRHSLAQEGFHEAPWTASKFRCDYRVEFLNSVAKFLEFAKELDMATDQDQQQKTRMINDCLHSADGEGDIRALAEIVRQLSTIHSVCDTEFIDKLYIFNKRIIDNGTHGILMRKLDHGLLRFSTLFTGQVILTCKRNLETKLEQAERSDEDLRQSLDVVEDDRCLRSAVSLVIPNSKVDLPENISTAMAMKLTHKSNAYIPILTVTDEIAEQFVKVKQACKLIDSYAQGSIYTIIGFAIAGFRAGDNDDVTDNKLKSSQRVARWLNAVQYCQGVTLIYGIPSAENSSNLAREVVSEELNEALEPKEFEVADQFEEIGSDLRCTFESQEPKVTGIMGWIEKSMDKLSEKFQ